MRSASLLLLELMVVVGESKVSWNMLHWQVAGVWQERQNRRCRTSVRARTSCCNSAADIANESTQRLSIHADISDGSEPPRHFRSAFSNAVVRGHSLDGSLTK